MRVCHRARDLSSSRRITSLTFTFVLVCFFFSFCIPEAPADSLWKMEENLDEKIDVFSSTCTRVLYVNEAILRT